MGRPARRVASAETDSASETAPPEPNGAQPAQSRDRVDLGDTAALKRTLDDAAAQVIVKSGFRENHTISNAKIGLGLFTCAWALLAQFHPKKYPHNWHVLVLCLVAYVICTAALNTLMWLLEGDVFLFANSSQGKVGGALLTLSSSMPKYQEMYTLSIQSRENLTGKARPGAQLKKSVTAYFDSEGNMLEGAFKRDVEQTLQRFLAKKQS